MIALTAGALAVSVVSPAAAKAPSTRFDAPHRDDNLPSRLGDKQADLKQTAQALVLNGQASTKGANKVVKVAKGQYVELAQEGQDEILTLLGEFGNQIHPVTGGTAGPLHNQIPQPNRAVDNTTLWQPDYDTAYYESILFDKTHVPSMANWYLEQSSGRYTVDGYVSNWVQVPYNEARYGTDLCGSIVCSTVWDFLKAQANAWWAELVADKGEQGAKDFLAGFDKWDRYDYNGNGNFNEPDGYIDHFQSIHAGEGEETGGGAQGEDAIWSHRWYAFQNLIGSVGPHGFGGFQIGDSGVWVGDYTIEPENGGVGVFAHEFGHDLGLPDEYDTSGNVGGAENGTGWWTNWSQGSYGTIDQNGLGDYPVSMDSWEKFELGWLNYEAYGPGQHASTKLGPVEANTKQAQAAILVLPPKTLVKELGAPHSGSNFYYSGTANNLDTFMTKQVTLPSGTPSLSAYVRYNIEQDWDYAYVVVSTDNGAHWTTIHTDRSTNTNPNSQNKGEGITGVQGSWGTVTANLSAYAGQTVLLGFEYWTDVAQQGTPGATQTPGFQIDDISMTGQPADGAETDGGWTFTQSAGTGFHVTSGTESIPGFLNAYFVEFRQYRAYDQALQQGPYQFPDPSQNWVEHFPYQDGMLVWYWDTAYADNNVGDHPGAGEILPVDSHPQIRHWSDGSTARPRLQSYDATFSLQKTDPITVHSVSTGTFSVPSQAGVSTFNDNNSYWVNGDPGDASSHFVSSWNSVNNPHTGTTVRIVSVSAQGSFMQIQIN